MKIIVWRSPGPQKNKKYLTYTHSPVTSGFRDQKIYKSNSFEDTRHRKPYISNGLKAPKQSDQESKNAKEQRSKRQERKRATEQESKRAREQESKRAREQENQRAREQESTRARE